MGRSVQIKTGIVGEVVLPDGHGYRAGDIATLTDAQWSGLSSAAHALLNDLGSVPDPGSGVSPTQYNAETVLVADVDDTPFPLTLPPSTVLGRAATGGIVALSYASGALAGLWTVAAKSAAYTMADGDRVILADASAATFAVTLPAATSGRMVVIKKTDASANVVTITPASGTIDGSATLAISVQYASYTLVSDGANWFIA